MLTAKEICIRIKNLRIRRGYNQEYVAKKHRVDRTTYVRKENGLVPITIGELLQISKILEVRPAYFLKNKKR